MKEITIYAHPYANTYGTLKVPDNLTEENAEEYVKEHFNEIKFEEPELDYKGTDYEIDFE